MQGKLSEIDIRSILQLIELGQRTGELFVEAYPSPSVGGMESGAGAMAEPRPAQPFAGKFWFVFFINGQIIYAADTDGSLSRLKDYLRRYNAGHRLNQVPAQSIAALNAPEYGHLWTLLENHLLTPAQGRSIIHSMVHETLFDLLSLHQGSFIFEIGPPLSPQLTTLEIAPLLARTMKQIQQWKQLHPYIQSPEQCPVITQVEALQTMLSNRTFTKLSGFADGNTSIRQIARYLNRDIVTVARAIYPYIQQGIIQLPHPWRERQDAKEAPHLEPSLDRTVHRQAGSPLVVCIDDGATVRATVTTILEQHGYTVTAIANPLDALSQVFRLNPDLILCDIAMPELDGYEVCAMLRKSTAFRQVPIVMLTGKDGFIDRVRARMIGATDYLTKPFGENELLMLVERYAGPGDFTLQLASNSLLANSPEDTLQIDRTDATSPSSTPLN
jgi:twitching motility two-component system response regulator PilG